MYTECPNCATVFKITAQQLNAAAGQVRCGRCNYIFSALGHLKESDEIVEVDAELGANSSHVSNFYETDTGEGAANSPLASSSQSVVSDQDEGSAGAPKSFLTEPADAVVEIDVAEDKQQLRDQEILSELANLDSAVNAFDSNEPMSSASIKVDSKTEPNKDSVIDETFFEQITQANAAISSDIATADLAQQPAMNHPSTPASQMMDDSVVATGDTAMLMDDDAKVRTPESYILEEVNNDPAERQRKWPWLSTILWTVLIVLLVLVLGAQLVYFNRTTLVKYPAVVPYLEKMCEIVRQLTECDVPDPIDLTELELLDRDVRSHPKSKNALLITATILNTAEFVQPYPRLVMSFSGLNDELIAQRPFFPKEYLSKEVDIKQGIPAGVPVRILLEIVDPGEEAVNFEFSFE